MTVDREELLDYYEIGQDLKTMDALATPSEMHGILCGQLCAGSKMTGVGWLKQFLPLLGVRREPWEALTKRLYALRLFCQDGLESNDLDFQLVLPDDEETIEARLHALSEWCSGFLAGFGSIDVKSEALPEEIANALRDLQSISQVDVESANENGEDGESDFFEVAEYVRIAVISLYQEFVMKSRIKVDDNPGANTLH